jgi:hypothetical protein
MPGITGRASPRPCKISVWLEQKDPSQLVCNRRKEREREADDFKEWMTIE